MHDLSERELEVLTTIIETFVETALPVGSRTVSKRSCLDLSAASIRNTMADLTEKGLLEQPHTSAGRIPSSEAFRYYIDRLLASGRFKPADRESIKRAITGAGLEIGDVLKRAGELIATLSSQMAMVLAPGSTSARLTRIDFIPVGGAMVLVILVLEGGLIHKRLVQASQEPRPGELTRYANYLNELFHGRTLSEVRSHIMRELSGTRRELSRFFRTALELADQGLQDDDGPKLIVEGQYNLIAQPEFAELEKFRTLLGALQERTSMLDILDRSLEADGLHITLSGEAGLSRLDTVGNVGFITAPYGSPHNRGIIGVMGPVRMDYARLVPVVDLTAQILHRLLTERYETDR